MTPFSCIFKKKNPVKVIWSLLAAVLIILNFSWGHQNSSAVSKEGKCINTWSKLKTNPPLCKLWFSSSRLLMRETSSPWSAELLLMLLPVLWTAKTETERDQYSLMRTSDGGCGILVVSSNRTPMCEKTAGCSLNSQALEPESDSTSMQQFTDPSRNMQVTVSELETAQKRHL